MRKYHVLSQYRRRAFKKGIHFELTEEQFYTLTQENCFYCGAVPDAGNDNFSTDPFVWNGIDRIDNSVGYRIDNCVPCCGICNLMKRLMTYVEFIEHTKQIVRHLKTPVKGILKKRFEQLNF